MAYASSSRLKDEFDEIWEYIAAIVIGAFIGQLLYGLYMLAGPTVHKRVNALFEPCFSNLRIMWMLMTIMVCTLCGLLLILLLLVLRWDLTASVPSLDCLASLDLFNFTSLSLLTLTLDTLWNRRVYLQQQRGLSNEEIVYEREVTRRGNPENSLKSEIVGMLVLRSLTANASDVASLKFRRYFGLPTEVQPCLAKDDANSTAICNAGSVSESFASLVISLLVLALWSMVVIKLLIVYPRSFARHGFKNGARIATQNIMLGAWSKLQFIRRRLVRTWTSIVFVGLQCFDYTFSVFKTDKTRLQWMEEAMYYHDKHMKSEVEKLQSSGQSKFTREVLHAMDMAPKVEKYLTERRLQLSTRLRTKLDFTKNGENGHDQRTTGIKKEMSPQKITLDGIPRTPPSTQKPSNDFLAPREPWISFPCHEGCTIEMAHEHRRIIKKYEPDFMTPRPMNVKAFPFPRRMEQSRVIKRQQSRRDTKTDSDLFRPRAKTQSLLLASQFEKLEKAKQKLDNLSPMQARLSEFDVKRRALSRDDQLHVDGDAEDRESGSSVPQAADHLKLESECEEEDGFIKIAKRDACRS